MTYGPIVRIALRYISGFLIAKGVLDAQTAMSLAQDPELVALVDAGVGAAIGVASEYWYSRAKKSGGAT